MKHLKIITKMEETVRKMKIIKETSKTQKQKLSKLKMRKVPKKKHLKKNPKRNKWWKRRKCHKKIQHLKRVCSEFFKMMM